MHSSNIRLVIKSFPAPFNVSTGPRCTSSIESSSDWSCLIGGSSIKTTIPTAAMPDKTNITILLVDSPMCSKPWNVKNTNRFPINKLQQTVSI